MQGPLLQKHLRAVREGGRKKLTFVNFLGFAFAYLFLDMSNMNTNNGKGRRRKRKRKAINSNLGQGQGQLPSGFFETTKQKNRTERDANWLIIPTSHPIPVPIHWDTHTLSL